MGNLHDKRTEEAAIRCALVDPELFRNHLAPGDFFDDQLRAVWQAGKDLITAGRPVNLDTLSEALTDKGIPESFTLLYMLEKKYESPVYIDAYAAIVKKWAVYRDLVATWSQVQGTADFAEGNAPDVDHMIGALQERLQRLAQQVVVAPTAEPTTWDDMAGLIGPVAWEWPGYLPSAFLALLVSDAGVGKSNLALRIAKTYLTGAPWPDGSPYIGEPGKVLWCEAEAAQALNLGRAKDWGLPCDRILSPMQNPLDDVNLFYDDHRAAIAAIAERDDVRLIVVDSLSGACAGKEKGEDQAPVVKWLAELARNVGKPVMVLHHLRKRGMLDGGDVVTLARVRGSTVIVQLARMVWALDNPDPNEAEHRRFAVIKSNLARFPEALGLRIGDDGITFDEAPQTPKTETQIDKAVDLLLALLDSGPLPSARIEVEAKGAGISWDTVTRAQKKLGVVARRDGRLKVWTWALPARTAEQEPQE